jgi:endogenous inhibitor of DNA gyrase (YacG/DUF329 family)
MINVRCPICSKGMQIASIDDLPSFPFCSDRCRLIDLGRWADGSYAVPESKLRAAAGEEKDEGAAPLPTEPEDDVDG